MSETPKRPADTPSTGPESKAPVATGVIATLRATPASGRFLLLGVFINQFGAFLQAFLVLYLVHRGFSDGYAGFALAAYGAGAVLGLIFGGVLADRLGHRRTIILSMSCSAVFTVAVSLVGWYPLIVVVVAAAGAMTQAYRPAAGALLSDLFPAERQVMAFAMNRTAMNLGAFGGPLLAAWLINVSWNLVFWLDGLTAIAYALIAVFLLHEPASDAAATDPAPGTASEPTQRGKAGYGAMLRNVGFVLFLAAMLGNALIYIQEMAVLPLTIKSEGYPVVIYSLAFAIPAGMVITMELLITRVVQHWAGWIASSVGILLLGIGLVGFGLPGGLPMLLAAVVICTVGQMVGAPTIFAWPAKVAPAGGKGRYLGAASAMFGFGQAVGPAIGVALWSMWGLRFWWVCGLVALLTAAAFAAGMRDRVHRKAEPTAARPTTDAATTEPVPAAQPAPVGATNSPSTTSTDRRAP